MHSDWQHSAQGRGNPECGSFCRATRQFGLYSGKRDKERNSIQDFAFNQRQKDWQIRKILQQRKSSRIPDRIYPSDEKTVNFEKVQFTYDCYRMRYGVSAYKYISDVFSDLKAHHKQTFNGKDHEQSWRAFKGKNIEKLVQYILKRELDQIGLAVLNGNSMERTDESNLSEICATLKRQLLVDYGDYGYHFPDSDLVIYDPKNCKVIASVSIKTTLRERVAQTGYWNLKLKSQPTTKVIRVIFISPDEDNTLAQRHPAKKGRAIVEADTDGTYVMSENDIEESETVKMFDKLIDDLKKWRHQISSRN